MQTFDNPKPGRFPLLNRDEVLDWCAVLLVLPVILILMYMGFDVDKAMLSSIARYLLATVGGFMLAIQMYFGYLILNRRGRTMMIKVLVFFPVYILTIRFYIEWGVFFSIPLR